MIVLYMTFIHNNKTHDSHLFALFSHAHSVKLIVYNIIIEHYATYNSSAFTQHTQLQYQIKWNEKQTNTDGNCRKTLPVQLNQATL